MRRTVAIFLITGSLAGTGAWVATASGALGSQTSASADQYKDKCVKPAKGVPKKYCP